MERSNVVVVGNGMVSHRFCERLLEYDRDRRYGITVVGEEPRQAYDRVHLTTLLLAALGGRAAPRIPRMVRGPRDRPAPRPPRDERGPRAPNGHGR